MTVQLLVLHHLCQLYFLQQRFPSMQQSSAVSALGLTFRAFKALITFFSSSASILNSLIDVRKRTQYYGNRIQRNRHDLHKALYTSPHLSSSSLVGHKAATSFLHFTLCPLPDVVLGQGCSLDLAAQLVLFFYRWFGVGQVFSFQEGSTSGQLLAGVRWSSLVHGLAI